MIIIITKLIEWSVLWILVWTIFYFLNKKRINYTERYLITSLFFLSVSLLLFIFFYKDLAILIKPKFQILPFICLLLMFVFNWLVYSWVDKLFLNHKKNTEADNFYFFAKFDKRYLLSKSFEILFQQTMIALLSVWLANYGLSLITIMFIFALVFGFGHLPNLLFEKKKIGLFFLIASVASSFVFPFLILNVQWGFVYSYILHWIFYIIAGFVFIKNKEKNINYII